MNRVRSLLPVLILSFFVIIGTIVLRQLDVEPRRSLGTAYLWIWLFWAQLAMGAYATLLILSVTRTELGLLIQPLFIRISRLLPYLGIAFLPLALNPDGIYRFFSPGQHAAHKQYFSAFGLTFRTIVIFCIWTLGIHMLGRRYSSTKPFHLPRPLTGALLILHVLQTSLGAVDWVMALEPHWHSSIVGFVMLGIQFLAGISLAALWIARLAEEGKATREALVSIGGLLLTAVIFLAYLMFCQYLLAWYGNLPERVVWYSHRRTELWSVFGWILFLGQVTIPFFVLLLRSVRASSLRLSLVAGTTLALTAIDMLWLTLPSARWEQRALNWSDLIIFLISGALVTTGIRLYLPERDESTGKEAAI